MVGHGGSSAGSYLADPTSPIPSHCASIVVTSTVRVSIIPCVKSCSKGLLLDDHVSIRVPASACIMTKHHMLRTLPYLGPGFAIITLIYS